MSIQTVALIVALECNNPVSGISQPFNHPICDLLVDPSVDQRLNATSHSIREVFQTCRSESQVLQNSSTHEV
ncbi:uncharacterized protein EKO05_0001847 [Ascochyta rabiei]|uniref:uncharacterized protein n=1 Tax=Didymella rabiei TaxID=5454 RepID=UPI00220B185A|nr:uncharacterized protein EKO05_0001847 [Ascochyta rabiei]UPX11229.1 hypothetical protein EKO05_0001847 [Ascochyta rabiei]